MNNMNYSLYDGLASFTSKLYEMGQIRKNSYAHQDRNGHFINTCGTWSAWVPPGAQTVASLWKGHSEDELVNAIEKFEKELGERIISHIKLIGVQHASAEKKAEGYMEMSFLAERIQQAIQGTEEGGGLQGLITTYGPNTSFAERIQAVVAKLTNYHQLATDLSKLIQNEEDQEAVIGQADHFFQVLQEENLLVGKETVPPLKYSLNYAGAIYFNIVQNAIKNYAWCNVIGEFGTQEQKANLILGALPIQTPLYDSIEEMKKHGVKAVLSIVEPFENRSSGCIIDPVKPKQLAEAGIDQVQLYSPDFETVSEDLIEKGVQYIHENLSKGRPVYVHCKAGRGRSALIIMCYLIKHQGMSAEQAFSLVRKQRPQAGFAKGESKYASLLAYEQKYRKNSDS